MGKDMAEATGQTPSDAVRQELERVGAHTADLLRQAGDTAANIVADARGEAEIILSSARSEADQVRAESDRYAESTRADADEFAQSTRGSAYSFAQERRRQAEIDAEGHLADAREEAEHIITVAHDRRAGLQTVIADLSERRDAALAALEGIAESIRGATNRHWEGAGALDPVPGDEDEYRPPSGPAWDDEPHEGKAKDEWAVVGRGDRPDPLDTLAEELDEPEGLDETEVLDEADDGEDWGSGARDSGRRSSPWLPPRGLDPGAIPSESKPPPG